MPGVAGGAVAGGLFGEEAALRFRELVGDVGSERGSSTFIWWRGTSGCKV